MRFILRSGRSRGVELPLALLLLALLTPGRVAAAAPSGKEGAAEPGSTAPAEPLSERKDFPGKFVPLAGDFNEERLHNWTAHVVGGVAKTPLPVPAGLNQSVQHVTFGVLGHEQPSVHTPNDSEIARLLVNPMVTPTPLPACRPSRRAGPQADSSRSSKSPESPLH